MQKTYAFALLASLAAVPLAFAHVDGGLYGTLKFYCEDVTNDQNVHDYGAGGGWDGSVAVAPVTSDGCAYDSLAVDDWDGHYEYWMYGVVFLACETACGMNGSGDGSLVCWGTYADHPEFPTVGFFDHLLSTGGVPVFFDVLVDYQDNVPDPSGEEPSCGDYEYDYGAGCVDRCQIPFPAGLDGSYQLPRGVNSFGHAWTE